MGQTLKQQYRTKEQQLILLEECITEFCEGDGMKLNTDLLKSCNGFIEIIYTVLTESCQKHILQFFLCVRQIYSCHWDYIRYKLKR